MFVQNPAGTKPRRLSLRWLIPAASAVILTGTIAAFGSMAYRFARTSALETAAKRLETVAEVFSQPVQPEPAWARLARSVAATQGVLEAIRTNGRQVANRAVQQLGGILTDTTQSLAVDIRRPDGSVVFSVASPHADEVSSLGELTSSGDSPPRAIVESEVNTPPVLDDSLRLFHHFGDTTYTSELYLRRGLVLYERAVPIRDSGRLVGNLVEVRKLVVAPATQRQLERLVGTNAALLVGNTNGSWWFDLTGGLLHQGPFVAAPEYTRDGQRWLSAAVQLPAAPWTLSVEFPVDHVLGPVRLLGRRFLLTGAFILLIGVAISERLSRRITSPLVRLTVAAENIAAGDRVTRGYELDRSDEIGRLSRAFMAMADSIRDSHDTLEHTIDDRTGELQTALRKLRETQDELLRKERLATLGQLSSSIAHELRNPLSVMMNSLHYLETVITDAPPKVRTHLDKVRGQVRLSESIIRGLLDSTRTTSAERTEVSLDALIREQLVRVDMPSNVTVTCVNAPNLRPALIDAVQVGQVLLNLIHNAIQAMDPAGGLLLVETFQNPSTIRLTIADTGPGIPLENRAKVFEPLFTTKARGIGLGLSVSRTLVQANEGELTVEDNPGGGARFVVVLPSVAASLQIAVDRRNEAATLAPQ